MNANLRATAPGSRIPDPGSRRVNTAGQVLFASLIGTSKKQVLVNAKINSWARDNRWHIQGDNRFYWTSQKTYGLGSDSPESVTRALRAGLPLPATTTVPTMLEVPDGAGSLGAASRVG